MGRARRRETERRTTVIMIGRELESATFHLSIGSEGGKATFGMVGMPRAQVQGRGRKKISETGERTWRMFLVFPWYVYDIYSYDSMEFKRPNTSF